ncbi:hypothetical protein [Lentzea californiensis]|uniref:hypothetical protein n=1 Tax=Lentzea californiensis TaxID=438851 RepID=UPI0021651E9B|nr:hypothetical protein [Lentzea californiensis]MCR3752187.1 hypothetical protein [Lentzea californiensis]
MRKTIAATLSAAAVLVGLMPISAIATAAAAPGLGVASTSDYPNGTTSATAAYPSDPIPQTCNGRSGCISGIVNWSNRSANLSIKLFDDNNAGSTTAFFYYYTANGWYGTESRTANNKTISGYPGKQGPAGGITEVIITLKANVDPDSPEFPVGAFYRDF